MAGIEQNANTAAGWITNYKKVTSGKGGSFLNLNIPSGVTAIRDYAFYKFKTASYSLRKVVIPSTVRIIGYGAFYNSGVTTFEIEKGVTTLGGGAFAHNSSLTTVNLPNSITQIRFGLELVEYIDPFYECTKLQYVTFEDGFNCNDLVLSASTKYSADTIVSWLNALNDRTGLSAYTLIIGSTNIAKLTAQEIAIATNKNWNLA